MYFMRGVSAQLPRICPQQRQFHIPFNIPRVHKFEGIYATPTWEAAPESQTVPVLRRSRCACGLCDRKTQTAMAMAQSSENGALSKIVSRHPLQRLHSPSRGLSLVLHAVGLCSFAKSFVFLVTHPNPINQSYGWHFQYLTILGTRLLLCSLAILHADK
jgi:FAR-17a/AIG1-like protein